MMMRPRLLLQLTLWAELIPYASGDDACTHDRCQLIVFSRDGSGGCGCVGGDAGAGAATVPFLAAQ